jgi:hypothetical protein
MAHGSFGVLVELVRSCQAAGVVGPGPAELLAVGFWSATHGLVSLLANRQLPREVLARTPVRRLLTSALSSHLREPAPARGRPGPRRRRAPRTVSPPR